VGEAKRGNEAAAFSHVVCCAGWVLGRVEIPRLDVAVLL